MHLVIAQPLLDKALARAKTAVNAKDTIPIRTCVLLHADVEGRVLVRGSGDLFELEEWLPGEVAEAGGIAVPAHQFADIVRRLPSERPITLTAKGTELALSSAPSRFTLPGRPPEDYPLVLNEAGVREIMVSAATLIELFEKSVFAAPAEDARYYLRGVYLEARVDHTAAIRAVATDGYRLARIERGVEGELGKGFGVIVPRDAVLALPRIFAAADKADLVLAAGERLVRMALADANDGAAASLTMTVRLVDGSYPEYERVLPLDNNTVIRVARKPLLTMLDRIMIVCDKHHQVQFVAGDGELALSARGEDPTSQGSDRLSIDYTGKAIETCFNGKFVVDAVSRCTGEEIEFRFGAPRGPALVCDPADPGALHVVMPANG
jgi:DNA polymerase-3 subunit beta